MRVVIATDMEGAAGIDRFEQTFPQFPEAFAHGSRELIADINACLRGLRAGGATEIKVVEGHAWGRFRAFETPDLDGRPEVLRGRAAFEAQAGWAQAVALLGYHAMNGTQDGFLSHTVTGSTAFHINGEPIGEMVMTAASAGARDIPVIMITGDHATMREASVFLPWVVRVEVKRATKVATATLQDGAQARRAIEDGARQAMARLSECRPLHYAAPLEAEAHFRSAEIADAVMAMPLVRRLSERAVGFTAPSVPEMMRFFGASVQLMQPVREQTLWKRIEAATNLNAIRADWYNEILSDWIAGRSPFVASERALRAPM
jgi:D-amino peptidase